MKPQSWKKRDRSRNATFVLGILFVVVGCIAILGGIALRAAGHGTSTMAFTQGIGMGLVIAGLANASMVVFRTYPPTERHGAVAVEENPRCQACTACPNRRRRAGAFFMLHNPYASASPLPDGRTPPEITGSQGSRLDGEGLALRPGRSPKKSRSWRPKPRPPTFTPTKNPRTRSSPSCAG